MNFPLELHSGTSLLDLPRAIRICTQPWNCSMADGACRLTEGGCAWLHGIVSIRKQHAGDGKNAIMVAFGAHTSMKQVVVVDDDVDAFDDRDVEWAIATRFQADRGLVVLFGVRGSSIGPSATDGFTAKVGIDATRSWGAKRKMFDKASVCGPSNVHSTCSPNI